MGYDAQKDVFEIVQAEKCREMPCKYYYYLDLEAKKRIPKISFAHYILENLPKKYRTKYRTDPGSKLTTEFLLAYYRRGKKNCKVVVAFEETPDAYRISNFLNKFLTIELPLSFVYDFAITRKDLLVIFPQYSMASFPGWEDISVLKAIKNFLCELILDGHANPNQIYLLAQGRGGDGAYNFANLYPSMIAGITTIDYNFVSRLSPQLKNIRQYAKLTPQYTQRPESSAHLLELAAHIQLSEGSQPYKGISFSDQIKGFGMNTIEAMLSAEREPFPKVISWKCLHNLFDLTVAYIKIDKNAASVGDWLEITRTEKNTFSIKGTKGVTLKLLLNPLLVDWNKEVVVKLPNNTLRFNDLTKLEDDSIIQETVAESAELYYSFSVCLPIIID